MAEVPPARPILGRAFGRIEDTLSGLDKAPPSPDSPILVP